MKETKLLEDVFEQLNNKFKSNWIDSLQWTNTLVSKNSMSKGLTSIRELRSIILVNFARFALGGKQFVESYETINKIQEWSYDDVVIIHDAARPLVSDVLINRCLDGCKEADGIMPVIPVKDTTYLSEDGKHIQSLLNRSHLWAGQAPEAFRFGKYIKVHDEMLREDLLKINGSTEIAFKVGLDCQMVEGDPMNFKITTPEDLTNFNSIIND